MQSLNDTVATLSRAVHDLEAANRYLAGRLREVAPADDEHASPFEVPPHY